MIDVDLPQFNELPSTARRSPRLRWNLLVDLLNGNVVFDPETKTYTKTGSSSVEEPEPVVETPVTRNISFTINDGTDPIEGASVVIGEITKTTGSAGGCSFNDVADGTVSVEISKEGFVTKTEEITVSEEDTSFTISLTAASTQEGTG